MSFTVVLLTKHNWVNSSQKSYEKLYTKIVSIQNSQYDVGRRNRSDIFSLTSNKKTTKKVSFKLQLSPVPCMLWVVTGKLILPTRRGEYLICHGRLRWQMERMLGSTFRILIPWYDEPFRATVRTPFRLWKLYLTSFIYKKKTQPLSPIIF